MHTNKKSRNESVKLYINILFFLIITAITVYSVLKVDYNWDVIGYVGSVYALESKDTNFVHLKTYEVLKNSVNESKFLQLTSANKYREELTTCARCFYQALPFYKIKPLYVILIYLFYKMNLDIVFSTVLISGIFYFLSCILIYFCLIKILKNIFYSFFISILLIITPYMLNSASIATPDSLSAFIILLALSFFMLKRNLYLSLLLMILSIFARPDNIFLLAILTGILLSNKDFARKKTVIILSFIIGILCVFVINVLSGSYGYTTLFYHSFVERLTSPADFHPSFSPAIYIKGMMNWLFIFKYSFFSIQMIIFFIAIYIRIKLSNSLKNDFDFLILISIGLSIIIHYIIFPLMDDRFFIAQYIIINLIFLKTIQELITSRKQIQPIK